MIRKTLHFCFLFFAFYSSFAQNIGIGTATPHASARLEISGGINTGLLIPRMPTPLIFGIPNPAKGLMVLDTITNQLYFNTGSPSAPNWQNIVFKSGWRLGGNSGINPASQFIGTNDNQPLNFRVNNIRAGQLDEVTGNVFWGINAGLNTTTGFNNIGIGRDALNLNVTGSTNTAIGNNTLGANIGGDANTALGTNALQSNTSGHSNIGIGVSALSDNTVGVYNIGVGRFALVSNTTGYDNIAIGTEALAVNLSGINNLAIGSSNSFINSTGRYNTSVGHFAYYETTNSWYNTVIGFNAGYSYDMGYNNVLLGANSGMNQAALFNCIAIGQAATNTAFNQSRIGNSFTISIGGYANWTNISDSRYKRNIKENVQGIEFIMKLRPVTYNLDITGISKKLDEGRGHEMDIYSKQAVQEKEQILFSGFIAQEVEAAAQESGYDFSGVDKPKNENDFYGLRYAEFVVPLVKAVQEQQQQMNEMKTEIYLLKEQNKLLLQLLNKKN